MKTKEQILSKLKALEDEKSYIQTLIRSNENVPDNEEAYHRVGRALRIIGEIRAKIIILNWAISD